MLCAELLQACQAAATEPQFLVVALPLLARATKARQAAVARGSRGRWRVQPSSADVPETLLAEALDTGRRQQQGVWAAFPAADTPEVLALASPGPGAEELAELWWQALSVQRNLQIQQRRSQRLATILEIAASWRQARDMDSLLQEMAEASTRLLDAERASIFLWDRPNKTLVGRPALGVEGGELRIPEDTGVVGQVVQTRQPARVDADDTATTTAEIDRSVDQALNFTTRTLLCVPLITSEGQRLGAFEMINKRSGNFSDEDETELTELAAHAALALENTQQYEQLLKARNHLADEAAATVRLIGDCPQMQALRSAVQRVADTELAILILGENGTGKEVVSQLVHYLSRRRHEPLVAVNCAALTESLLESELFGHEKGAFTDARETRAGKFELASGGTLFLDEIGDMSLSGQAKLLRVLEEKIVVRVGGSIPIHTDARVIAATNQNLAEMVRDKRFREDLYFRLNVVTLDLPPLRERGDDILTLAGHFLNDFCQKARRKIPRFTAAAKQRLLGHTWPGNVRELRNLMERMAYLTVGDKIDAADVAFIMHPGDGSGTLQLDLGLTDATTRFQVDYIRQHIRASGDNMTEAARRLGLHRSNLYRKMRQLGMGDHEGD